MSASAQLDVTVAPPHVTGQKAIVRLAMKNEFTEKIESVRAAAFLLDENGKMVGQATKWVIGGANDRPPLLPGATNTYNFVVQATKPFTTTNITAKVTFTRIVLEGGKLADPNKEVKVHDPAK
jgi:hypothetical protein